MYEMMRLPLLVGSHAPFPASETDEVAIRALLVGA
jgi:hypothetical protein